MIMKNARWWLAMTVLGGCGFPALPDIVPVEGTVAGLWHGAAVELRLVSGATDETIVVDADGDFRFSDNVEVGDSVVAIGNPFGLSRTVTAGIVSAIQRQIEAPNQYEIDHVIQTDAPINHGNSGGPLINARGEVIGVNAQIEPGNTGGNVGVGFAVPSNTVKSVVAQLLDDGRVDRAFLGVTLQDVEPDVAQVLRLPAKEGVLVAAVKPGSPAAKAGIVGGDTQVVVAGESYQLGGDMIVAVDGKDVTSVDELRDLIAAHKPGDTVSVTIVDKDGKRSTKSIELARLPENPTG